MRFPRRLLRRDFAPGKRELVEGMVGPVFHGPRRRF